MGTLGQEPQVPLQRAHLYRRYTELVGIRTAYEGAPPGTRAQREDADDRLPAADECQRDEFQEPRAGGEHDIPFLEGVGKGIEHPYYRAFPVEPRGGKPARYRGKAPAVSRPA